MKEVTGIFQSEIIKPIITLVLPGVVLALPTFAYLLQDFPALGEFTARNKAESTVVLVLACLFVGLILEEIGSRIEESFDSSAKKTDPDFERCWYSYLANEELQKTPGHRFMRTLVLRLKFELSTQVALVPASVFAAVLLPSSTSNGIAIVSSTACAFAAVFLYIESRRTHASLAELRCELLKREEQRIKA